MVECAPSVDTDALDRYFASARERHQVMLRRESGAPHPWTDDPVLAEWRFCNVHREHDAVTRWFRENVRSRLTDSLAVTRATIAFRWFNRIETGEKILDLLLGKWSHVKAEKRLRHERPVVTGAYIINGYPGYSKLDGVLMAIDGAFARVTREVVKNWGSSLQQAWQDLSQIPYLGGFMAYEIVSDLRWTPVLYDALDINLWANAGPGCARGLSRLYGSVDHFKGSRSGQKAMLEVMQELLVMSRCDNRWPTEWLKWEMREVEHWSCEFDKYERARGGRRLKRRYQ